MESITGVGVGSSTNACACQQAGLVSRECADYNISYLVTVPTGLVLVTKSQSLNVTGGTWSGSIRDWTQPSGHKKKSLCSASMRVEAVCQRQIFRWDGEG
eukprot:scaffold1081_cov197-Alexandrium_tamarense.AAC.16